MRVLIACEYSGVTRTSFLNKGWDAWSCDILPTVIPGQHYQGNVLDIIGDDWDLLIARPPCTYLTYAGMNSWYSDGRATKRIEAAKFFMQMYDAPVQHICVENPQGIMSKIFRAPDQVVHPYYFGEREMKRTCYWLKNLPPLFYQLENDLFGERTAADKPDPVQIQIRKSTGQVKKRYWTDCLVNGKFKTGHEKSKSFKSIADAMAEQWTDYIHSHR